MRPGRELVGPAKLEAGQGHVNFTDLAQTYAVTIRNAALTYREGVQDPAAAATITLTKTVLDRISLQETTFGAVIDTDEISIDGDSAALTRVLDTLDDFELMFNIARNICRGPGRMLGGLYNERTRQWLVPAAQRSASPVYFYSLTASVTVART